MNEETSHSTKHKRRNSQINLYLISTMATFSFSQEKPNREKIGLTKNGLQEPSVFQQTLGRFAERGVVINYIVGGLFYVHNLSLLGRQP